MGVQRTLEQGKAGWNSSDRGFFLLLPAHGVEYLVIGGHAVALHGYPRATADLDVWVAINQKNALRLVAALKEFGFDVPELTPDLFLSHNRIIRMGVAPNRIEIQIGIDGVEFTACSEEVWVFVTTWLHPSRFGYKRGVGGRSRSPPEGP